MEERGKDAILSPPSSYEVDDERERGMDSPFSFPWEINSWSLELDTWARCQLYMACPFTGTNHGVSTGAAVPVWPTRNTIKEGKSSDII